MAILESKLAIEITTLINKALKLPSETLKEIIESETNAEHAFAMGLRLGHFIACYHDTSSDYVSGVATSDMWDVIEKYLGGKK